MVGRIDSYPAAAALGSIPLPTTASPVVPPSSTPPLAMPAFVIRRKRSRRGFDPVRRTRARTCRPVVVMQGGKKAARDAEGSVASASAPTLPDDMLLEVFKRLPFLPDVVRCGAVCRRWRRAISGGAAGLPAPPRHFGFFRNYAPSPVPPFVPTAGVNLDIGGFLPLRHPGCGALLVDARGRRLLLRELGPQYPRVLNLLVCSPLGRASARVPPLYVGLGHRVAMCALVPSYGAAFRVVVVLFGDAPTHVEVLVYSSADSAWEAATAPMARALPVLQGPSVVIGDVVYKLQTDEKYIMAADVARFTVSAVPVPDTGTLLYSGNHWIGKTDDGRLCFFAFREQLLLVKWVLEAPGKWAVQQPVDLRSLMRPALMGDLAQMKLSAKMADQLHGCKLVSFSAFCEGTGMLFLVMADCVVALDLKSGRMERLWRNTDEWRPLDDVFPCELQWPPAVKDHGEA